MNYSSLEVLKKRIYLKVDSKNYNGDLYLSVANMEHPLLESLVNKPRNP